MNDRDRLNARHLSVVEIAVYDEPTVLARLPANVYLGAESRRAQFLCAGLYRLFLFILRYKEAVRRILREPQILYRYAGRYDADLDGDIIALIRHRDHLAALAERHYRDLISRAQLARQNIILVRDLFGNGVYLVVDLTQPASDILLGRAHPLAEIRSILMTLDLLELGHDIVASRLCALDHSHGFSALTLELPLDSAVFDPQPLLLGLFIALKLLAQPLCLRALALHIRAALFKPRNNRFKSSVLSADVALRPTDYLLVESELTRYCKRIRLSGRADYQPVGRAQRFEIEFAARIAHPVGIKSELLKLGIVRRRRAERARLPHPLEYRDGKRRTLYGVGARTELVEQHETAASRPLCYIDDADHMRREGRQRLLDALLVADIGEHAVKYTDDRALARRQMKSRLRHKHKQSERFQRYRLTTRIRSRYDEHIKVRTEPDIYRHDFAAVKQRMPCAAQLDKRLLLYFRCRTVHTV